jgi:hypothetical protein
LSDRAYERSIEIISLNKKALVSAIAGTKAFTSAVPP